MYRGKAEVRELDVRVVVTLLKQEILGFEISTMMYDDRGGDVITNKVSKIGR